MCSVVGVGSARAADRENACLTSTLINMHQRYVKKVGVCSSFVIPAAASHRYMLECYEFFLYISRIGVKSLGQGSISV